MFFSSGVNESATREFVAAQDLQALTAVELTADGVSVAGESSIPLGLILNGCSEGDDVTVQLAGGGYWLTSESLTAGDFLCAGESGMAAKATSGKFIFAQALEDTAANTAAQVQIVRAGKA